MKRLNKFHLAAMLIMISVMTGCGQATDEDSIDSMPFTEQGKNREDTGSEEVSEDIGTQEESMEAVIGETVKEIPIDMFPFEKSEPYLLTLALREEADGKYELRLYDKTGKILQQIPCSKMEAPISSGYRVYSVYNGQNRKMIAIHNADDSNQIFVWDGKKFSETESITLESGSGHAVFVEYKETSQIKTAYVYDEGESRYEEARLWQLEKDTGSLKIWDALDKRVVFEGIIALDDMGDPLNQEYYDMLFLEFLYEYRFNDENPVVHGDYVCEDEEWHLKEYENKDEFLAEYGVADSEPVYQYYDINENLQLELYENKVTEELYGITYENYYYNGKKQKKAKDIYAFSIGLSDEEKWTGENAYSKMTEFKAEEQDYVKDYEEFIEYTPDGLPAHFLSQGMIVTQVEVGEYLEKIMSIHYVYRDDNTLFYRSYGHSSNVFQTAYASLGSYYDKKGRVICERGYHTNGYLRDYYIYEDDGDMPTYHLHIHYSHGRASAGLSRYYQ